MKDRKANRYCPGISTSERGAGDKEKMKEGEYCQGTLHMCMKIEQWTC
jgi:hypothetical protein